MVLQVVSIVVVLGLTDSRVDDRITRRRRRKMGEVALAISRIGF